VLTIGASHRLPYAHPYPCLPQAATRPVAAPAVAAQTGSCRPMSRGRPISNAARDWPRLAEIGRGWSPLGAAHLGGTWFRLKAQTFSHLWTLTITLTLTLTLNLTLNLTLTLTLIGPDLRAPVVRFLLDQPAAAQAVERPPLQKGVRGQSGWARARVRERECCAARACTGRGFRAEPVLVGYEASNRCATTIHRIWSHTVTGAQPDGALYRDVRDRLRLAAVRHHTYLRLRQWLVPAPGVHILCILHVTTRHLLT